VIDDAGWRKTREVYKLKAEAARKGNNAPHVPVLHHDLQYMLQELEELDRLRALLLLAAKP
jgi:hypothetical protein